MLHSWTVIKSSLRDMGSLAVEVFTTGERDGFRRTTTLLLTCGLSSLLLSSLLLLYLLVTLAYESAVAAGVAACCGTVLTVALFLSRRMRCFATLFVISMFMKKSRNLLLTAGTSLVVLRNIRNTLENLTGLVRSMICNLKAKKASITAPFSNYVKMLKWLGGILKGVTDLGVVNFDSQLKISPKVEVEGLNKTLNEAELRLNQTVQYVQGLLDTVSSVTDWMFPALSFTVLVLFLSQHIKKYCRNMKYKNRYISRKFVEFDERQRAEGKPHVLPLSPEEQKLYACIPSVHPTAEERKAAMKFGVPVVSHFTAWLMCMTVDALLYCFVDTVTTKLSEMEPFHVPLLMSIQGIATLIGVKLSEEKYQKDFSYSVTLFEKQCLPKPKLLLHRSIAPLGAILLTLLIMTLAAAKMAQLRLMVCERFFSTAADARAEYLHAKILRKRLKRRKEKAPESSFTSLIAKPHFWCPLLFSPGEDQQSFG